MKFIIAKKIVEKGFIFKKKEAEALTDDEIKKILETLDKFEKDVNEEWKKMKLPGKIKFEKKVVNGTIELDVKFPILINITAELYPNKNQMASNLNNYIREVSGVECEVRH
jgi:ribosomal protein S13